MDMTVWVTAIIAIAIVIVVIVLRDRIFELVFNFNDKEVKVKSQTPDTPTVEDEPSPRVVFKGNTLRGEGEYRMQNAEFSKNDVDGTQKVELGYDSPSKPDPNQEP